MKRLLTLTSFGLIVISLMFISQSYAKAIDPETCISMWLFDKEDADTARDLSLNGHEWHHLVATYDGDKMELFLNGVSLGTQVSVRTYSCTAHFDDILVKGEGIPILPGEPGLAVNAKGKLATIWSRLKTISN